MAHPKIEHDELVSRLFDTFRELGYDGASLMHLSEVTGLKKASLYHRFPGGKDQMVEMVLDFVEEWIKNNVTLVLQSDWPPQERLNQALKNLQQLYADGKKPCMLRALSLGNSLHLFGKQLERSFTTLLAGFRDWAISLHLEPEAANRLAESVVIRIQGALVMSRAMNNPALFQRTMDEIHQELSLIALP
jgi:TetR/AcrR family transcriptional regulator, lmrAB and yxaGH operons repressor